MTLFGQRAAERRTANAKALAKMGVAIVEAPESAGDTGAHYRTVREGKGPTIFTIGYEKRSGEDLIGLLRDAGVDVLVDVRQRAMSRKADFRGGALAARCEQAGIEYLPMSDLGSTEDQRDALHESGDIGGFMKRFRAYARRNCAEGVARLAGVAGERTVALLCYERCHDECHRSIVAELVGQELDASVVAII